MKKVLLVALLALTAATLGACESGAAVTPAPPTTAPAATSAGTSGGGTTLTILAAASLTDSFKEIAKGFEAANPGVKVAFSFAGSQTLRTQIQQGVTADVFASADNNNMDPVKAANLLASDPQIFTRNLLVVILPKANPGGLKELKDLSKAGTKLIVAASSVPVGNYTLQALDKLSADPTYGSDFKAKVLAQVVSNETDVKAVVTKVGLGEGDAGVVYTTDAKVAADKLTTIAIPEQYNVVATYPIAVLKSSPNASLALKFVDYVLSSDGQAVLAKYGFAPK
ncbi:MAG: molybdate ABC transporter substrate-binding protein [Chloroflexi bacterium]|nr:molybdate ABC transporter substrate-binding protein [Chloroflexota bacterium]